MRLYSLQMEGNSLQLHDYYSKFIIYGKVKTEFVWIKDFLLFCERIFIYTKGKSEILRARFNCIVKSQPYNRLSIPILLSTQTVLYYHFYMYRRFTHPELLRRLSHCGLVLDDIVCDLHRPLFNIILQEKSPCTSCFYNLCRGKGSHAHLLRKVSRSLLFYIRGTSWQSVSAYLLERLSSLQITF